MLKSLLLPMMVCSILISCTKKEQQTLPRPIDEPNIEDIYKDEFLPCNCGTGDAESSIGDFLKAEINGIPMCADLPGNFSEPSFGNMLIHGSIIRPDGKQYYDNLYMIRYTRDRKFMFGIFLENTHALTKQYPYELPRINPEVCEIGEFQLENQHHLTNDMCAFCPTNTWHYLGQFYDMGLKLTVENYENKIFSGKFSGTIRTGSGRLAKVTNGQFRIHLTEIERDVVIP